MYRTDLEVTLDLLSKIIKSEDTIEGKYVRMTELVKDFKDEIGMVN